MFKLEIFLPVYDLKGIQFEYQAYDDVQNTLIHRYGGVTAFMRTPASGFWKNTLGQIEKDDVAIFEVMTEEIDRVWWQGFRKQLEHQFAQQEILIQATQIERL